MNRAEMLEYYGSVRPAPRELAAFQDAVRLSAALGVKFQPGEAEILWWHRGSNEPFGFILRTDTKPVPVWLGTGGAVEQIVSTAAHELHHCREHLDGHDGLGDNFGLDDYAKRDRESHARAQAFAARVLARWRAERRPRPTIPQPGVSTPANERSPRMRTANGPALEVSAFPQLADRAARRVDQAKLATRRRIASSRRVFGRYDVLSDNALVKLTVVAAFMEELLSSDDLEGREAKILIACKDACAARLESVDAPESEAT